MEKGGKNKILPKSKLDIIESVYFIQKLFANINKMKSMDIIRYNKNLQKIIYVGINDYKELSELNSKIQIDLICNEYESGNFINIINKEDEPYFHIYLNDSKEEIRKNNYSEDDEVSKIKIIIDQPVKSFYQLFKYCDCIEAVYFTKFARNNITNMSYMFTGCSSLQKIEFLNFNSSNAINMEKMFSYCPSLKELDVSKFNTEKVINMNSMFEGCSSLKKLDLSNFNVNKVTNMENMFSFCSSLIELNLSNFNVDKATNVNNMFNGCSSLKDLNLSNSNIKHFANNELLSCKS